MKNVKALINGYYGSLPKYWVNDWLLHVIHKPASFLITDSDYILSEDEQSQFDAGIAKMQSGVPLAYLTGKQAFWSLEFEVSEHTLIPRPDTEVLVEYVLERIHKEFSDLHSSYTNKDIEGKETKQKQTKPKRLLDLGTGTGCIAISLAHELQVTYPNQWQVHAIDISPKALEVAKRNAKHNQVDNISFDQSSWFDGLVVHSEADKFDVIVSNPPYIRITDEHLTHLKAEPLSALVAEDNGLADIKSIVSQAIKYLKTGGLLAIEHGYDQGLNVRNVFSSYGYNQVETIPDYGGNDRVTLGFWF